MGQGAEDAGGYEENPFEVEEMILKFLDDNCYDLGGPLPQSYR